jgi:hypothetical protein
MKKVVDRAEPVLTKPSNTPAEKVSAANIHIAAVKNSADWATATEVQTAAAAWSTENDNLAAGNKLVAECKSTLAAAQANLLTLKRRWELRKNGLLNAVNAVCDGSKDKVQGFGLGVVVRKPQQAAEVPEGLRGKRSKTVGTVTVVWPTRRHNRGFLVQYATDPANPATYSVPRASSKGKFELAGQTPGATIYFRVLAFDPWSPNGQTDYSPWVAAMVSS